MNHPQCAPGAAQRVRPADTAEAAATGPLMGFGSVRHRRLRPAGHAFSYATYFLMLPMRSLRDRGQDPAWSALPVNRPGLLSFWDRDHGDGRGPEAGGALAWLDETLRLHGIDDAVGETWLHCFPRVLGFTFKPVSFWFCHRAANDQQGALRAIVVEVNNTFGERHCYLLDQPRPGALLEADKVFHVSPFLPLQGRYGFRFLRTGSPGGERTIARIDYADDAGPVLQTSISGRLETLTRGTIRRAFWRHPLMTWGVVWRIHWHALRLWLKGVPITRKPAPPLQPLTR